MKKIIVLTSSGGGGHIAATHALIEHFGQKYHIEPVFPFKSFLAPTNIPRALSFGKCDGEETYNFLVRKNYYRLINFIAKFGCSYFSIKHKSALCEIKSFLLEEKPDLVISLIPLINCAMLEACKELNIPFLVIPTDLNTTFFLCNLDKPAYKKFAFTIAFESKEIKEIIKSAQIPTSQIIVTGFLVRPGFLKKRTDKELTQIKHEYHIEISKPVILVLMGAQGSERLVHFAKELNKLTLPAHLLICIGKNKGLLEKINQIQWAPHISHTTLEYTDRMPELMAIADLLITKSGSLSVLEALYVGVPLIIDTTQRPLTWEEFNVDFVLKNKFGKRIKNLTELAPMVEDLLIDKVELPAIKKRIENFPKKNGLEEISKIIEALISQSPN